MSTKCLKRRLALMSLARRLPRKVQGRYLPLRSEVQSMGSSSSCVDLVDIQSKKSHAKTSEEHQQVLSCELHLIA